MSWPLLSGPLLACNSYCCLQKSYQKSWFWVMSCHYSSLITLYLDYWNICLKYSRNNPAHLSTWGLECFGQKHLIFQEMDDIIPLSVSCAALPIIPSFTALCWFTLSSTHLIPELANARSYDSLDKILLFSSIQLKPSKCTPTDYLCTPQSRGRVSTDRPHNSGKVAVPQHVWLIEQIYPH